MRRMLGDGFVMDGEVVHEDGEARPHFLEQLQDRPALAAPVAQHLCRMSKRPSCSTRAAS